MDSPTLILLWFCAPLPLILFLASWIPQWKINVAKFYAALDCSPFMSPYWLIGGLQLTTAFAFNYTGIFFVWYQSTTTGSVQQAAAVLSLCIGQMLVFSVWQIPHYYYRDSIFSLALLMLCAIFGIAALIVAGVFRFYTCLAFFSVWNVYLSVTVIFNLALFFCNSECKTNIATPSSSIRCIIRQGFLPEPIKVYGKGRKP